jgi:hypothetical protein
MTVALIGVGADTTNVAPTPPVYPDGTFEYVPIPDAEGPDGTAETATFGSRSLRHGSGTLADALDSITPTPTDGPTLAEQDLADWPLHHDPNFEALTYGETTSRPAYTQLLASLEPGDAVAFYTGLCEAPPDGDPCDRDGYSHRYLIGYFTVDDVVDFGTIHPDSDAVSFTELSADGQRAVMADHRENAHAKRFRASGAVNDGDGLVIVDGREPGGLLERAVRISEHHGGAHHYLTDECQERLDPVPSGNPDRNAYLGGIKQAHRLRISPDEFREYIGIK